MKIKPFYYLLILSAALFLTSCATVYNANEQFESDMVIWNENDSYYEIAFDSEAALFQSDCPYVVCIEKNPDKDFVILNLADIQLDAWERGDNFPTTKRFVAILDYLVDYVNPDLITFTGDFGDYGNNMDALLYVSDIIDSLGIPWAPVFGNHDNEGPIVTEKALALSSYKNCLFRTGPVNLATLDYLLQKTEVPNLGNYIVNIVEPDDSSDGFNLVNSLVFMNTGSNCYSKKETLKKPVLEGTVSLPYFYGSLSERQLDWYSWAIESAKQYNRDVKSTLFIHIPIFAYNEALIAARGDDTRYLNVSIEDSFNDDCWSNGYEESFGVIHEITGVACPEYDDNVFQVLKKENSTNLVICGHDHANCAVVNYDGIVLAYALKTGSGSYWETGLSGGTAITINSESTGINHVFCNGD